MAGMNISAILASAANDEDFMDAYGSATVNEIHSELERAQKQYNDWLDAISDFEAHEAAFEIVEKLAIAERANSFLKGFKAGIRLILEANS